MQIRKFEGKTMAEALRLVKKEFGPDAVILSSGSKLGGGSFGLFGSPMVEITAALDRNPPAVPKKVDMYKNIFEPPAASSGGDLLGSGLQLESFGPESPEALKQEIKELKRLVATMKGQKKGKTWKALSVPQAFEDIYSSITSAGVSPRIARALIEKGASHLNKCSERKRSGSISLAKEAVALEIMSHVKVSGDIKTGDKKGKAVAFVGPTGVGKTTTIAKLAAKYSREGKDVALISIDSYRVGAVEQFKIYAGILKTPAMVASSPRDLREKIAKFRDKDLILIDTAGRSQRDKSQISFLREFFPQGDDYAELHLLMSATTHDSGISDIVKRFGALPIQRHIFTKLDECSSFGSILNALERHNLSCSYFTTGQRVPEDLELASPERVADLILRIREEVDSNRLEPGGGR